MMTRDRGLSLEDFEQHRLAEDTPVILEGVMADWPAMQVWSMDYFRTWWGNAPVDVCTENNGEHRYDRSRPLKMEFSRLLDSLARIDGSERHYFMAQTRLQDELSDIANDIPLPDGLCRGGVELISLWMAASGTATHLHWDSHPALLALVRGRKAVSLFSPDLFESMYPVSETETRLNWSQVDFLRPDRESFPTFAGAKRFDLELRSGEILYIPQYWWHCVSNLEPSMGVQFLLRARSNQRPWADFYRRRQEIRMRRVSQNAD
jgi:hypothetical protein